MRAALYALVIATAVTGCKKVECGEGTFRDGDNCIAFDPNDHDAPVTTLSPDGKRSRDPLPTVVMLETSESADIYFTTDGRDPDPTIDLPHRNRTVFTNVTQGLTIKYFAIDSAGNREDVKTATYASDTKGPGKVTNFTVGLTGTTADVSWVNPTDADYTGVVLARVRDLVDGEPAAATFPAVGEMLPTSTLEVIAAGDITEFHDTNRPPGPVRYVVWTHDDLGNYSSPVGAKAEIPIGATTIKLSIDVPNDTVTVLQQPDNFAVTATATHVAPDMTVTLNITNNTTRLLQNPKLELISATSTTLKTPAGTADTHPFHSLGLGMLPTGTTPLTTQVVFTGITAATTTEVIELTLASHPSLVGSRGFFPRGSLNTLDLGSGLLAATPLNSAIAGPQDRVGGRTRPSIQVGQRTLDVANSHGLVRLDLVTRTKTATLNFDEGAVQSLIQINGAEIVALLKQGTQRTGGPATLVKFDEALHIKAKVPLPLEDASGFVRPTLSPDGSTIAIPMTGVILLFDADTLAPVDLVPETPEVDTLDVGISGRLGSVTYFNATDFVVTARDSASIAVVSKLETGFSSQITPDDGSSERSYGAVQAPDGRVWIAFDQGLKVFNPTDQTLTTVGYPSPPFGISLIEGKLWVHRTRGQFLDQIDETTGAVVTTITAPVNAGFQSHWTLVAR